MEQTLKIIKCLKTLNYSTISNYSSSSNYNSTSNHITTRELQCERKWALLACDMLLKENNASMKNIYNQYHLNTLKFLLELVKCSTDLTENEWKFVIDCTRKGIKRVGSTDIICKLLNVIDANISKMTTECADHLLKLAITCKESAKDLILTETTSNFNNFIDFQLAQQQDDEDGCLFIDQEFNFIDCYARRKSFIQKCRRLIILFDPLNPKLSKITKNNEYLFLLFSMNDSELISLMKILIETERKRFFEFYSQIICKNLLKVDFFIEQLLTDPVKLLSLLLLIFSSDFIDCTISGKADFINFHTLFLLKLEQSSSEFPFHCQILIQKISNFINRISQKYKKTK